MKFIIFKDHRGEWRWTLRAKNGRKIADSGEGYKRKGKARGMVEKIILGPLSIAE